MCGIEIDTSGFEDIEAIADANARDELMETTRVVVVATRDSTSSQACASRSDALTQGLFLSTDRYYYFHNKTHDMRRNKWLKVMC